MGSADTQRAADSSPGHDPSERARLRQLVDEQAALRRVATLVAGGAGPAQVFTAVADELSPLIGAEATFVSRVDHPPDEDGELEAVITVEGSYGTLGARIPVGFQLKLLPEMVQTAALRTGRPARGRCERLTDGPFGVWAGARSARRHAPDHQARRRGHNASDRRQARLPGQRGLTGAVAAAAAPAHPTRIVTRGRAPLARRAGGRMGLTGSEGHRRGPLHSAGGASRANARANATAS